MPRLSVWMVRAALLHLGTGFTFGAFMLWNKGSPFDPRIGLLLSPHIELVLVGWTMQLAMGVAFWIVPRFTHGNRYGHVWLVWAAFVLINAGVIAVVISYWFAGLAWLTLVGHILESLAVVAFALHLWPRIKPFGETNP
jgi:hypothetical protein